LTTALAVAERARLSDPAPLKLKAMPEPIDALGDRAIVRELLRSAS